MLMNIVAALKDIRNVFALLVFLLVFFIALVPAQDADMWWHLSAGREMVAQGKILTSDIFSYTHYGETWTNAFWLSDIVLYLAYVAGGYPGITLFVSFMAALTMAVLYRRTIHIPFPIPLLVILIATFAIAPVWTPRPQIFSFLLLAILDYGLKEPDGFILKRPWFLVVLFIFWANIHGGFIWGFLLVFAHISGNGVDNFLNRENSPSIQQAVRIGIWALTGALAIALNPNGLSLWKLPFYTIGVSIQSITEWSSPDFHRLDLHPLLWMLFLIIAGAGNSKTLPGWGDILKAVGFAYMAFISQRSIGPFVIVATPVVANSVHGLWREWSGAIANHIQKLRTRKPSKSIPTAIAITLNSLILGIFILVVFMRAYSVSTPQQVRNGLPWHAIEWIRTNQPEGRMFNAYNWGGYLQWELPEYPVFIDGRADLYGEKTIGDWWSVVNATDKGLALLDSWQVNFVIVEPGWPVLDTLSQMGWRLLYEDKTAVIMGR